MRAVAQVAMLAAMLASPSAAAINVGVEDARRAQREPSAVPQLRGDGGRIHPSKLDAYARKRRRAAQGKRGKR